MGRRSDGYHNLCMLMQKVDIFDEVWIGKREDDCVCVECVGMDVPEGDENIASLAARALISETPGTPCGFNIRIVKHIPVAAGLGGGSSDAATVLLALNSLLGLNLKHGGLAQVALRLGADVPFFLGTSPAWAEGVGEVLTPLKYALPECCFVLVNPGVAVPTAQVYRRVEQYSHCQARDGEINTLKKLVATLHNDLEPPALQLAPEVREIKEVLANKGALGELMSGSGATVFGVFSSQAHAHIAVQHLEEEYGWWARVATGVS